jgi:hypothetical protein
MRAAQHDTTQYSAIQRKPAQRNVMRTQNVRSIDILLACNTQQEACPKIERGAPKAGARQRLNR